MTRDDIDQKIFLDEIQKQEDQQIVEGIAHMANVVDAHNDYFSEFGIKKFYDMMETAIKDGREVIDGQHDRIAKDNTVINHYISDGKSPSSLTGKVYPKTCHIVAIKVHDKDEWEKWKTKKYNAFSWDFKARVIKGKAVISFAKQVFTKTSADDGHEHHAWLFYDNDGNFVKGYTSPELDSNGILHNHMIKNVTNTRENSHGKHRVL